MMRDSTGSITLVGYTDITRPTERGYLEHCERGPSMCGEEATRPRGKWAEGTILTERRCVVHETPSYPTDSTRPTERG